MGWGWGGVLRWNSPFVHCEDLSLGLVVTSPPGEENGAEHGRCRVKVDPERQQIRLSINDPRDCVSGQLIYSEGARDCLHPGKNGQLDSCGDVSSVGARISGALHLHTQRQQGPEEGIF